MCLGEIGQVSALGDGGVALIAVADVERRVLLATLDETVALGDWLVVHSGFALARLDPDEAAAALTLRATPVDPAATPPQR
ncbi:MAG: HypC/HybG/HupF family hydrogenase formation chaperone [Dermatophilaceae bacterium]